MLTARSWRIARRYVTPPLAVGALRLMQRRRDGLLALGAAAAAALFFRDPERSLAPDPALAYSAADGVVKEVDRVRDPWIGEREALRIGTFLSLRDVHVNRSPIAGTLTRVEELHGGFRPAFLGDVPERNRRDRLAIDGPDGPAVVIPMAGILARRISRWVQSGQRLHAGQRIGLIHFGSRTDVLLPADRWEPLVQPGARVRAGATPIARRRSGSA